MRLGYACITLGLENSSMRAAQLGRYRKGLVDLAPIYAHNADYARRSVEYAASRGLLSYRVSSDLFPLLDVAEDARALAPSFAPLAEAIRRGDVHVSNHPSQFVVLSSPREEVAEASLLYLEGVGWVMESIGARGSITLHGGGVYDGREAAGARMRERIEALGRRSPAARALLALENDEKSYTIPDLVEMTRGACPLVFDNLHWAANPRSGPYDEELRAALASWPEGRTPEVHYSEQAEGKPRGAHAERITGAGLLAYLEDIARLAPGRDVAVVVEAKRKDLAVLEAISELAGADRRRLLELVPALAKHPFRTSSPSPERGRSEKPRSTRSRKEGGASSRLGGTGAKAS